MGFTFKSDLKKWGLPRFLTKNPGKTQAWPSFITQWSLIALVLHLIAAWRGVGFYHADEHFQIVEFAFYKLGYRSAQDLPLEFHHLLRPWLFPAILTQLTRILQTFNIHSPFDWALVYRLFSALVGWLSIVALARTCPIWFKELRWQKRAVMALVLIWYMPALHARHSSENLAGSVFFIGLALLANAAASTRRQARSTVLMGALIGILFGLAFQLRYQVGVMIFGTLAWFMLFAKVPRKRAIFTFFIPILIGMTAITALGLGIDRWGYGQWTFTPWNYLKYNLIQNHVADMDASPTWDYFRRAVTESWPLLGILALISWIMAWILFPRHILTWSTLPFFALHLAIGHKELRFLFPLAHVGGILFTLVYQRVEGHALHLAGKPRGALLIRKFETVGGPFILFWNAVALIILTCTPAGGPIGFYSHLYIWSSRLVQSDQLSQSARPVRPVEALRSAEFGQLAELDGQTSLDKSKTAAASSVPRIYYQDDRILSFGGAHMQFYRPLTVDFIHIQAYEALVPILVAHSEETPKPVWLFYPYAKLSSETIHPEATWKLLTDRCQPEFSTLGDWENKIIGGLSFLFHPGRITDWTIFRCEVGTNWLNGTK